mgnify:CR=1 FL=1
MRIVIFASSKFSIPLLEKLHKSEHEICAVYSQPPSISGRGMKLKENEVCLKSRELNLKLLFPDNINKDIEINKLEQMKQETIDLKILWFFVDISTEKYISHLQNLYDHLFTVFREYKPNVERNLSYRLPPTNTIMEQYNTLKKVILLINTIVYKYILNYFIQCL